MATFVFAVALILTLMCFLMTLRVIMKMLDS
jgi:hypothetical protein